MIYMPQALKASAETQGKCPDPAATDPAATGVSARFGIHFNGSKVREYSYTGCPYHTVLRHCEAGEKKSKSFLTLGKCQRG